MLMLLFQAKKYSFTDIDFFYWNASAKKVVAFAGVQIEVNCNLQFGQTSNASV